jgi:hypothetical protein
MQFLEPGDPGVEIVGRGLSQLCQQRRHSTKDGRPFAETPLDASPRAAYIQFVKPASE